MVAFAGRGLATADNVVPIVVHGTPRYGVDIAVDGVGGGGGEWLDGRYPRSSLYGYEGAIY